MHNQKGDNSRWLFGMLALCSGVVPTIAQADTTVVTEPTYLVTTDSDASGAVFKGITLKPSGCVFTYTVIGHGFDQQNDYRCRLVSATGLIARHHPGIFTIEFDLPSGHSTQNFILKDMSAQLDVGVAESAMPFNDSDVITFANPPPRLQDVHAVQIPPELELGAVQGEPQAAPMRIKVSGLDCRVQLESRPESLCILVYWDQGILTIRVAGALVGQPDPIVTMGLRKVGDRWYITSSGTGIQRRPEEVTLLTRTADTGVGSSGLGNMPEIFRSQVADSLKAQTWNITAIIDGKNCTLRDTRVRYVDFDSRSIVYPCEIIWETPAFGVKSGNDYGIVVDTPEGKQYTALLRKIDVPRPPPPPAPQGMRYLDRITPFTPGSNPAAVELDLPTDPAVHISVKGFDCTLSAAGHGSFPCLLTDWSAKSLSIAVNNQYFYSTTQASWIGFGLEKYLLGWGYQGSPQIPAIKFGPPAAPARPATSRQIAARDTRPPLMIAVSNSDLEWTKELIDGGADVNVTDYQGNSLLGVAVEAGAHRQDTVHDVVLELVLHGVDVNHADNRGSTPIRTATFNEEPDIAKILADHGARYSIAQKAEDQANMARFELAFGGYRTSTGAPSKTPANAVSGPNVFNPSLLSFHTSPAPNTVSYVGKPGAAAAGESVTVVNVYSGQRASYTVRGDGSLWVDVPGVIDDLYSVEYDTLTEHGKPMYMHGGDSPLTLNITVPTLNTRGADIVIDGDDALVMGTYTGPPDTGIVVGDQVAMLSDGMFIANHVSLKPGANKLTLTATTLGGRTLVNTVEVKSDGVSPLHLYADTPDTEAKPLEMAFGYRVTPSRALRSVAFSSTWDGPADLVVNDPAVLAAAAVGAPSALTRVYPAPGVYPVSLTVTDMQGVSCTLDRPILVADPAEMDRILKSVWDDFLSALAAGNRQAAVSALTDDAQKQLSQTIDRLIQHQNALPTSSAPFQRVSFSVNAATYTVARPSAASTNGIDHVGFKRGPDGVWRIDAM